MKKMNKKGFTIVELVIVIAVIGILAAVLIPTFSSVIDKANTNSALQAARNEYTLYVAENAEALDGSEDLVIVVDNKYYVPVTDGQLGEATEVEIEYDGTTDLTNYYVATTDTVVDTNKTYYTFANDTYTAETDLDEFVSGTTYYENIAFGDASVAIYEK